MAETPAAFPMEKLPHGFQCLISHVSGSVLSGCGECFSEIVKENRKRTQLFWFVPPPPPPQLRQAGHRWGEEEGMGELWVVVLKHWSWSCVGNLMSLEEFHWSPEAARQQLSQSRAGRGHRAPARALPNPLQLLCLNFLPRMEPTVGSSSLLLSWDLQSHGTFTGHLRSPKTRSEAPK